MKKQRNNKTTFAIYVSTWLLYLAFSFFLFPTFNLTVFGLTVPLAMLGGWFYGYFGAITTSVITILYNFWVLYFYIAHPENIGSMAVGCISCTLFFSLATAHIKSTRDQIIALNASLRIIVDEKTKGLRLLADYLVRLEEREAKHAAALLAEPLLRLEQVLVASNDLVKHFKSNNLPESSLAESIDSLIRETVQDLTMLRDLSLFSVSPFSNLKRAIQALASQLESISEAQIRVESSLLWALLDPTTHTHLYPIIHEGLLNAVKHGRASRITIGIKEAPRESIVYIENTGKPVPDEPQDGMGLPLIRYHATKIGASVCLTGGQGKNTILECKIPLMNPQSH